jgi:multiple sugar transport system substrate-binding protein
MNGTQKMLDEFTKQNPNITVKLENCSWEEYWQKIQTQIASNTAPDVFLMDAGWYLKQFAPKGVLADIGALMQKDNISKDDYFDVWKTFTYEGKIYAMPRDYNSIILYYNKDLFKKAGLTQYPDGNMSWEQLAEMAKKLTVDKNGKNATESGFDAKNIVQFGLHVNTPDTDALIETMIFQNGGRLFSEDGKQCYIDSPEARPVLQYLHDITWKYNVKQSPAAAAKLDQAWFQSGNYAMVYQGSWMMSTLADAKFDWDIAVPPTFGKKIYCVQSVGNSILTSSKHPDEAWELVKFLSGKDGQTIMSNENDAIPVLKDVAENVYSKSSNKPENKKAIFDAAVESVPYVDIPKKGEIFEGIKNKLEPYFNDQKSLDEAIKDTKAEVERIQSQP